MIPFETALEWYKKQPMDCQEYFIILTEKKMSDVRQEERERLG